MALNTPFVLSVETDAGTYQDGFHYGWDEKIARSMAVEFHHCRKVQHAKLAPKGATRILTVALMKDGKIVDTFDGYEWASDIMDRWEREEEEAFLAEQVRTPPRLISLELH